MCFLSGNMAALPLEDQEFEELISEFQPRLFAFIYSLTKDQTQAQDVAQNTNIILWNKRDQFQLGSNFKAWAFQVAYYEVKYHRKKAKRSKETFRIDDSLLETLQEKSQELDENYESRRHQLKDCLKKLPEDQKELIVDRYYGNESVQTMADRRSLTPYTMAKQISRIRKLLMHCIDQQMKNSDQSNLNLLKT
jgi:RNA polymerase sigma-70 factor (ECF subfamily)